MDFDILICILFPSLLMSSSLMSLKRFALSFVPYARIMAHDPKYIYKQIENYMEIYSLIFNVISEKFLMHSSAF